MSNVFVSLLLKTHNSITEYSKCDTTGFNVQFFFSLAWLPRVKFDWLKLVEGDSEFFLVFLFARDIFMFTRGNTTLNDTVHKSYLSSSKIDLWINEGVLLNQPKGKTQMY